MTRLKHVLILTLLVLPMFALAPSLVTSSNGLATNNPMVDTALPANFVEESLRVAVYVEDNTTLPAYASGGVITNNYANVIQLLENEGYDVTPMSTQDILDHKLMTANFDAFVLVDQLPKDDIVNMVKDYWLAGGGILSFHTSIGFLYYHGMIVPADTGNFGLLGVDVTPHWGYDVVYNFTVGARHSVAKDYQQFDTIIITENTTMHDVTYFSIANPGDFVPVLMNEDDPGDSVGFALDNTARQGGRIVQLPGNCSTIPDWEESIIVDSIDWLAPRPKGRILYDLTHMPNYGIDSWDSAFTQNTLTQTGMRNMLVNRSYTFDKLYPPSTLSTQNLEAYDILVIHDPQTNFTAAEVAAVTDWVNEGGSILAIADHTISKNQNMNYLLSNMDIAINHTATGTNALVPSVEHVTHEGCTTMSCLAPGAVGTYGSAFSIWEDVSGVPVIGGDQHGNGRVILIADTAIVRDTGITSANNAQALINFVNWLSSATAEVLVYTDRNPAIQPDYNYYKSDVALALNSLGIQYYLTSDVDFFNLSLATDSWDLVISDGNYYTAIMKCEPELLAHMESGGKLIMRDWRFRYTGYPLWNYLGFEGNGTSISASPPTVYLWASAHPIFNLPADYGAANINSTHDFFGTDFSGVTLFANATAIAGISTSPEENTAAIVLGANGRAICNMFSISEYIDDTDDSTYSDAFEIFTNEIAYLYFDRPTISHPDDVTYMETETGNEIVWTATADAGAWEYIVKENGSIIETGLWNGGAITINVDGVNASLTDYQLTVFDRLGYSASDLVVLNVTEYVEPTTTTTTGTGTPLDPMLLLLIGVGAVVVIVVIIIVMKKKK